MKNSYNEYFSKAKKKKVQGLNTINNRPAPKHLSQKEDLVKASKGITKSVIQKSRKKRHSSSLVPLLLFATGVTLTGWGYLNIESVISFIERVEVSPVVFSEAVEKSEEKKSPAKSADEENVASDSLGSDEKNKTANEDRKSENINHFTKLNDRKTELDLREKELNELESELHEQRKEIEVRIKKLEDIRSQIGQVLKDKVEVDEERVIKLVEFYSNMKPQNAAQIIATLNEDLAVEILGRMKKKNAADILNLLKPEKAQVLTEKFAGYKRR